MTEPTEPVVAAGRTVAGPVGGPRTPQQVVRLVQERPFVRVVVLAVLALMAGADAFGFWNTLNALIQSDAMWVALLVIALAAGAVFTTHLVGYWARSRQEGFRGSIVWMATLTVLWSALGLAMFSIRASHPLTTSALGTDATGALAGPSGGTSSGSSGLPLAIVLLIVYLLTGAVAMTHGYRTGDPAADALRKLLHRRARLIRDLERARHDLTVARGQSRRATQNLDNEEQLHRAEKDTLERVGEEVTADGKHRVAMHQADPSRTDGLFHPDAEQQAG